ncbi:MAG: hypothetical protein HC888_14845 [Candidatus Competibacteraceae bacterium]|nr:hypothetical protein [Candidatus Competibacteraceae bacterium]
MALRIKILLVTSSVVLCLLAVYYLGLRILVVNQLATLDGEEAVRDLLRVNSAGQAQENYLEAMCHRLGFNDAMHRFALERDPALVERILTEDLFRIGDLSLVYVCDTEGRALWQRIYAGPGQEPVALPEFPPEGLPKDHPLLVPANQPDRSWDGFFLSSAGPIQVAAKPILNSAGEGPSHGTIIVGRIADAVRVEQMRKQTQVAFSLVPSPWPAKRFGPPGNTSRRMASPTSPPQAWTKCWAPAW